MATKYIQDITPFGGVAPGQTATCNLTIGPRYHVIWLGITASPKDANTKVTLADVCGLIVMKRNDSVFRSHDVVRLDAIQKLWDAGMGIQTVNLTNANPNAAAANGDQMRFLIPIYLADPSRKSYASQEAGALYTVWKNGYQLRSLTIEVTLPNTGNLLDNSLSLKGWAETTNDVGLLDDQGKPLTNIFQITETFEMYSAAGKMTISNLEKAKVLYAMHFFTQDGDPITDFMLTVDNRVLRNYNKERNDAILIGRGLNPAGLSVNRFDVPFDYTDVPTDVVNLDGVNQFLVEPTLKAANAAKKTICILQVRYGSVQD